jgi:hypothetical protein
MYLFCLNVKGLGHHKLQSSARIDCISYLDVSHLLSTYVTSMYLSTWTAVGFVKDHLYFFYH